MDILYDEGVVVGDDLAFAPLPRPGTGVNRMILDGTVYTTDGGELVARKRFHVVYRHSVPYVTTAEYVYMALRRAGGRAQPLFRYDNAHGDVSTLHRHWYDDAGDLVGVEPVAPDELPYMDDVIRATAWLAAYLVAREA